MKNHELAATLALSTFTTQAYGCALSSIEEEALDEAMAELICSILHMANKSGLDPYVLSAVATDMYKQEKKKEKDNG